MSPFISSFSDLENSWRQKWSYFSVIGIVILTTNEKIVIENLTKKTLYVGEPFRAWENHVMTRILVQ